MTKFALVRVEGTTREVLGAKGVSPGCTADTRDHTDYPLTVCDRFHGETSQATNVCGSPVRRSRLFGRTSLHTRTAYGQRRGTPIITVIGMEEVG